MKFLSSKFALPAISAFAVLTLVAVQAMALSQSPDQNSGLTTDHSSTSELAPEETASETMTEPSDGPTPIVIPEGQTTLPDDDDDEDDDEDEDDEFEDEDDDEFEDEDEDDDEFEDEDD